LAWDRPGICAPFLTTTGSPSPVQERQGAVGEGPEEGHKDVRGLQHLRYGDRLRELGLIKKQCCM